MKVSVKRLKTVIEKSDDLSARREALIELGYEKDPEIYPVLINQLNDDSSSIQHAAVIALGRLGNPQAIEEIVKPKILNSSVVNIRWAAVGALGRLGDFHIIESLVKAVEDPEWIVRNQAVTEIKEKIREINQIQDVRHIRILIRLLAIENDEIVDLAIEGLSVLGKDHVNLLLEALDNPSYLVRMHAAKTLGLMKAIEAEQSLLDLLQDISWQVRKSAAEALGEMRSRNGLEALVHCLADNVEKVQRQAVKSLVGFGKMATESILNSMAHEKSKFVLRAMISTLGEIGDLKSVPDLISHLRSSYFVVRVAAVKALIRFGPSISEDVIPVLLFNQSNIKPLLKDAADHTQPQHQLRAIRALGGLEDHRAVNLLKQLVEKGTVEVKEAAEAALFQIGCGAWGRCSALIVLREIGDQSLVKHFIYSLKDDSNNVRLEAVRALAHVNGPEAIDPLILVAKNDRDPYIRFEAVRNLRMIGVGYPHVLQLGLASLKDPYRDVRVQAAWLLGNFQDDRSIRPLLRATADPHWSVRESAEIALHNFGKTAIPQLINAMSSKNWTTRFRAARLLGEMGDERAIGPLEKILNQKGGNREVRKVVKQALEKLKLRVAV